MRNKRFKFSNRRHNNGKPGVPFKDSHGATISECRRKIPDRRVDGIQAAMVNINSRDQKAYT
jgi:hypothetical protein